METRRVETLETNTVVSYEKKMFLNSMNILKTVLQLEDHGVKFLNEERNDELCTGIGEHVD